jgi:hypothetical protein
VQKPITVSTRAEAHHLLDAGAVVPAAVEQNELARRRKMLDVALEVPVRTLSRARGRQSHDAAPTRVEALDDAFDRATLARRVPPLEDDGDARAGLAHPLLHQGELELQAGELVKVGALAERRTRAINVVLSHLARRLVWHAGRGPPMRGG